MGKINIAKPKILTWVNTGQKINIAKRKKKRKKKIKLRLLPIEGQEEGKRKKEKKKDVLIITVEVWRCLWRGAWEDWCWELGKWELLG